MSSPRPQAAEQLQCPLPASLPLLRFRSHDIYSWHIVPCCTCFATKAQHVLTVCWPTWIEIMRLCNLTDSQGLAESSNFKANSFSKSWYSLIFMIVTPHGDLCTFKAPRTWYSPSSQALYIHLLCSSSASPKYYEIRTSIETRLTV